MEKQIRIRLATINDLAAIDYIYNQAISHPFHTGDLKPLSSERRAAWFTEHDPENYPIYIYEQEGKVLAWLSLSAYRPGREAMGETAEISYYVDFDYHGQGIGAKLVRFAIDEAVRLGKRTLLAVIIEGNHASIALLKKFGFEQWGYLPGVVRCQGEARAHIYMGKQLDPGNGKSIIPFLAL